MDRSLWEAWKPKFSTLDSRPGALCSRAGLQGQCVVFFGKTLYSHSASLHPGV